MVTRYDVIYVISNPFYPNTHYTEAFFFLILTLKNVLQWHLIVFFSEF